MATWKEKLEPRGWTYRLWRDEHLALFPFPDLMNAMPEWNGKADLLRYFLLATDGGVCVDADSECLEPLDDSFLAHDAWACWESEPKFPGRIATGYLASATPRVGGPNLMLEVLREIERRRLADPVGWAKLPAWVSTGPVLFTQVAQRHPELHVYPAGAFLPTHWSGVTPAPYHGKVYARQFWGSTITSPHYGYAGLT